MDWATFTKQFDAKLNTFTSGSSRSSQHDGDLSSSSQEYNPPQQDSFQVDSGSSDDDEEQDVDGEEGEQGQGQQSSMIIGKRRRSTDEDVDMEGSKFVCMDLPPKPSQPKHKHKHKHRWAMYGKSLEAIPSDLNDWSMLLYPKGKRCLLTTCKGQTQARLANGKTLCTFQSILPNGSKNSASWSKSTSCALDCVFDNRFWTFYVIDILCWKEYATDKCDRQFREFWMQTRLHDASEMDAPTAENTFYTFRPVQPLPISDLSALAAHPAEYAQQHATYEVDGIFLYRLTGRYTKGKSKHALWLAPDQLPQLQAALNDVMEP
ncbi:hypothetical protein BCR43DRAFT_521072 [Syncephalastrum racemosum]|uniref:Snurportin-1 n=1 Tax=Syncephalastrum racemosum TaxID=13706 RepID=A0A1X2HKH1_SYNRA|nr:hypothetical protein BCR43DRAFT_521072 [Syncephalastrum racemosum]